MGIYNVRPEEISSKNHLGLDQKLSFFTSYLSCIPSLAVPLFFFPRVFNKFLVISYTLAPCQDFSETCRIHIPKSKP